jgi:hypothetical protein
VLIEVNRASSAASNNIHIYTIKNNNDKGNITNHFYRHLLSTTATNRLILKLPFRRIQEFEKHKNDQFCDSFSSKKAPKHSGRFVSFVHPRKEREHFPALTPLPSLHFRNALFDVLSE